MQSYTKMCNVVTNYGMQLSSPPYYFPNTSGPCNIGGQNCPWGGGGGFLNLSGKPLVLFKLLRHPSYFPCIGGSSARNH